MVRPSLLFLIAMASVMLSPIGSEAQRSDTLRAGKWGIEADYLVGKIFKHTKPVNHVPKEISQGFQVDFFMKTYGEKPWHKPLNFPEIGGTVLFIRFGENKVFGDVIALMGYAKFYMYRSKVVNLYTRLGAGYGYITRKYDYLTNPTNNLISSPINLSVQIKIGMEWKMSPNVLLSTAFSFNHFSNSATNLPNYGANLLMGSIGIRAIPVLKDVTYDCTRKRDFKKNEFMWMYTLGIQESYGFNGPKYPIHSGTVAYARYTSPGNKLFAGLSYEYLRSIHDFIVYNEITVKNGPDFQASAASVVLGDEILVGHIGMHYSAGVYLWKNMATYTPIYFKLGANVYFAQFGRRKGIKFFVGNYVKAHTSIAQANEFSLGGCF